MYGAELRHAGTEADGDAALVGRVLDGDERAFEQIMRRYNRRLYRIARSIVKDDLEAEDVVQESYVRAFANLEQFVGPDGFASWLGRIAVNESLKRMARRGRLIALQDEAAGDGTEHPELIMARMMSGLPDPEELAANGEIRRLIENAVDALPDAFRTVFVLRDVEQLNTAETASALNLRQETVKTRLHRGRALLQKALSEQIAASAGAAFPFAGERCDRTVALVLKRIRSRRGEQGSS